MKRSLDLCRFTTLTILLGLLGYPGMVSLAAAESGDRKYLPYEENTIQVGEQASPSVVAVSISGLPNQQMQSQGGQAAGGSGFVVDDQGRIITNFHVVARALKDLGSEEMTLTDGAKVTVSYVSSPEDAHEVRVLGANPDVDLALLELIDPDAAPNPPPLPLADSDTVRVGEKVIVIGNPFGLHSSLTAGTVSAVERDRPGLVGIEIPYIQIDAAINPGNSGGPLLNSQGQVTGISNAVLSPIGTFAGIGLAVPSNLLADSIDEMREGGLSGVASAALNLPERPRLGLQVGMTVRSYPAPVRSKLGMPETGVVVTSVAEGGPAEQAGIRGPQQMVAVGPYKLPAGMDIITAIEGQKVERPIDLQKVVLQHEAGNEVTLEVWRNGDTREVDVELKVVPVQDQ